MPPPERLSHHELCFGCGQANLFGLQLELARSSDGGASGRFFVKQDHQGPPGHAHGGVLATALDEAMALLVHAEGVRALTVGLSVELSAPVPVGTYVDVEASIVERSGRCLVLEATAGTEAGVVARARGTFVEAVDSRSVD